MANHPEINHIDAIKSSAIPSYINFVSFDHLKRAFLTTGTGESVGFQEYWSEIPCFQTGNEVNFLDVALMLQKHVTINMYIYLKCIVKLLINFNKELTLKLAYINV